MKIAHIADTHLGFRAYNRITSQGLNRREADVFMAFRQAMNQIAQTQVDLLLIAGDLFHVVRPSNLTIQQTYREFASFRAKSSAPIVIIGGNHDSPRSADTGCILDLFTNIPGIYVVHGKYEQVLLENLDTSVFCLCHRALPDLSSLKIEPDPASKYNILMVHGTLEGVIKHAYDVHEIQRADVISDSWNYIAFGHYHCFEELAPNAYYSGSLEYTSTNIWSETKAPKGFVVYNLDDRKLDFQKTETRDVVDLRAIDAAEVSVADLNIMIQNRIEGISGGHENKIIRLVVENLHRSVQADLDYSFVRKVRAEALHFELVLRPPSRSSAGAKALTDSGVARPLEEEWDEFAKCYDLPQGVERDRLVTLGRDYLMKQAVE